MVEIIYQILKYICEGRLRDVVALFFVRFRNNYYLCRHYGTELYLGSFFPRFIRYCSGETIVLGRLRRLPRHDGLYVQLVEDCL